MRKTGRLGVVGGEAGSFIFNKPSKLLSYLNTCIVILITFAHLQTKREKIKEVCNTFCVWLFHYNARGGAVTQTSGIYVSYLLK